LELKGLRRQGGRGKIILGVCEAVSICGVDCAGYIVVYFNKDE